MVPVEDSSAETDSAVICAPAEVSFRTFKGWFTQMLEYIYLMTSVNFSSVE